MAFLTKLNSNDIKNICLNYNIKKYKKLIPIYDGIQNSNYVILGKEKYILTIFEDKEVIKNLSQYFKLMIFLKNKKFNCPVPIYSKDLCHISIYKKKKYSILTFLKGKHIRKHNLNQCLELGNHLALLHKLTKNSSIKINNDFNYKFFNYNIKKYKNNIIKYNHNLYKNFKFIIKEYQKISNNKLPKGLIHGDLFPDNVLFYKGKISGFIDFYYSCNNYLINDLAIVIISWCFNKSSKYLKLNINKIKKIYKGYIKHRIITIKELEVLSIICKIYCIRFYFTRLIDMNKNYDLTYTQIKNPHEYLDKFLYLEQNKTNFKDILINE
tara:strand:- start:4764 stop:5738 length:975 start_codon:yes stop_codon:yes gene_type:complete